MKRREIDIIAARELLDYNPETGLFTWKERPRRFFSSDRICKSWNSRMAGSKAGYEYADSYGYKKIMIGLNGVDYCAHRLAWAIMLIEQPPELIDHINLDATDNRWINLRDASGLNQRNKSMLPSNTSGYTGVSWHKGTGKWRARITGLDGREKSLGYFNTKEEAAKAVKNKREELGYSINHGKSLAYYRIDGGESASTEQDQEVTA